MPPRAKESSLKAPDGVGGKAAAAKQIGSLLSVIGDEDTVTGMLLAGIGNVDARRTSNFLVVDSKTTPAQVEEAFHTFTKRSDIAVLIINQYIASMIRETIDNFVRAAPPAALGPRARSVFFLRAPRLLTDLGAPAAPCSARPLSCTCRVTLASPPG